MLWGGLAYMATQFGILARLTWWEYSWDIMEPVTYFITYGSAMAMYAYFVMTRQVRLLFAALDTLGKASARPALGYAWPWWRCSTWRGMCRTRPWPLGPVCIDASGTEIVIRQVR